MPELPSDPDQLVRAFIEAFARHDVDEMVSFFTDDAVYHNVPIDPCVGKDQIREFLAGLPASGIDMVSLEIHHQATAGNVVMNERTDTLTVGGNTVALPVAGVFEIEGGRIKRWSDYFDMGQFTAG